MSIHLRQKAHNILQKLCLEIPTRQVGSRGNRAAADYVAERLASAGFEVEKPAFDCMDWRQEGAELSVADTSFEVQVSPYSLGSRARASLVIASTLQALERLDAAGKILLLRGELTKEQLMPKNFPFYNPDEHQRIIQTLEDKQPAAIVAATSRNPEVAGALYPFPLIEDGDFHIPSVYMIEAAGEQLAQRAGEQAQLDIRAWRYPARGYNVTARKGRDPRRRVVVFAHLDAKQGTPGALDNASGVAVLALLAMLLADYDGALGVEMVALNGEDYYSAPGEKLWLERNEGRFDEILLGINLDGAGYIHGGSAYSLYGCPAALSQAIESVLSSYASLAPGEPWYQGDHGLFLMHERPALAITSQKFMEILAEIAHTPQDRPELVAEEELVHIALALWDLILELDRGDSG